MKYDPTTRSTIDLLLYIQEEQQEQESAREEKRRGRGRPQIVIDEPLSQQPSAVFSPILIFAYGQLALGNCFIDILG